MNISYSTCGVKWFITHIIRIYVSRFKAEWNCYHTARLKLWIPGVETCLKPKTHIAAKKCIPFQASAPGGKNHSFSFMMLFMFMHLWVFHVLQRLSICHYLPLYPRNFKNCLCFVSQSFVVSSNLIWCLQNQLGILANHCWCFFKRTSRDTAGATFHKGFPVRPLCRSKTNGYVNVSTIESNKL